MIELGNARPQYHWTSDAPTSQHRAISKLDTILMPTARRKRCCRLLLLYIMIAWLALLVAIGIFLVHYIQVKP